MGLLTYYKIFLLIFLFNYFISANQLTCDEGCLKCKKTSNHCTKCKDDFYLLQNHTCISLSQAIQEGLHVCNVKHCSSCKKNDECSLCQTGFILSNKKCYSTQCEIYGACKYCTDYDCLKCEDDFSLEYGFCEKTIISSKVFYILCPCVGLLIISLTIIIVCCYKKRNEKGKIIPAKMLNFRHPSSGNYIIVTPSKDEPNSLSNSINPTSASSTFSYLSTESIKEIGKCVICSKDKIFSFTNCGCGLCKEHSTLPEEANCPVHLTKITNTFIIKREQVSKIKGNAIENLGKTETVCSVCKSNVATNSFNCGCPVKLCSGCFNDNVFIYKFNKCPGCGKPYNPKQK